MEVIMSDEAYPSEFVNPSNEYQDVITKLPTLRVNDLIQLYRTKRDELSEYRKEFQQREANVKDLLSRISMALRDIADELGVDSFNTPYGTAYRNVKTYYRVGDWDAVLDFIQHTGNWHMLEKRIAKNATREIHNDLGNVPPGIEYSTEIEFAIRKPSKST